jgi:hypothetical protein
MREMLRWDPFQAMKPIWSGEPAGYAPAFEVKETKDGFVSVRLDQVTSLEVTGASLAAMLKQEPKTCFEEANG